MCFQWSRARAWLTCGVLVCAGTKLPEVTAERHSTRILRSGRNLSQLHSVGSSGPAAQALAQLAEGRLGGIPAEWWRSHESYVKRVKVRQNVLANQQNPRMRRESCDVTEH